jgi:hypothetical protein
VRVGSVCAPFTVQVSSLAWFVVGGGWVEHERIVGSARCWVLRGHPGLVGVCLGRSRAGASNACGWCGWWCLGGSGCGCLLSVA